MERIRSAGEWHVSTTLVEWDVDYDGILLFAVEAGMLRRVCAALRWKPSFALVFLCLKDEVMKKPFIDHSWSKIVERDAVAKVMIDVKLKQLDEIAEAIRINSGSDTVENVLDYTLVKRALERCLVHLSGATEAVTADDYYIYSGYADYKIAIAENIIDSELNHLGL